MITSGKCGYYSTDSVTDEDHDMQLEAVTKAKKWTCGLFFKAYCSKIKSEPPCSCCEQMIHHTEFHIHLSITDHLSTSIGCTPTVRYL